MKPTPNVDFHLVSSGSGLEAQFVPTEFARELDRKLQEALTEGDRLRKIIYRAGDAFMSPRPDPLIHVKMLEILHEAGEARP